MAVETLTGVGVTIAGTDISDHVKSVSIDDGRAEFDDTVMSHAAKSTLGGLPEPSITISFLQDYAATKTHALLRAAVNTSTAVVVRAKSGTARSGTNPEWQLTGKIFNYKPLDGSAGQFQTPSVTFKSAGTAMSEVTAAT